MIENKTAQEFDDFLCDNVGEAQESVASALGFTGDTELSSVIDNVTDKKYNISIDDIVKSTIDHVRTALHAMYI